jgi:hypothetical protein
MDRREMPGVRRAEVTGRHLRMEVRGPVAPVIGARAGETGALKVVLSK